MSQVDEKNPKHCAKKGLNFPKFPKKLWFAFSTSLLTILSVIFLVWLTLHPTKPHFSLQDAGIYQLNLFNSNVINSTVRLTLLSNNPNKKVGIYYDELRVYASYKGQIITRQISLPPFYQGNEETNLLTASLDGNQLPVASSFRYEVGRDQRVGKLLLSIKVIGRLRWKVGTWVSGRYRFNINCVAVLPFNSIPSGPLSSKQGTVCSTVV